MQLPTFSLKYYFTTEIPQEKASYEDDPNQPTYEGLAPQGATTAASVWIIRKHFYEPGDSGNRWIGSKTMTNQIWDNRASVVFL